MRAPRKLAPGPGACGACPDRLAGRPALCRSRGSIGSHVDGGFAEPLVTHVFPLDAWEEGFAPARSGGGTKVVLTPAA